MAIPFLPSCSSKSSGSGFGDDASSSSGGGSSSGTSSGASDDAGTASSSGTSGSTSGSSSGSSSGTKQDAGSTVVVQKCGTPCDLRQKTCCLPADGGPAAAYCIDGTTGTCGANVATFHCAGVDDCPTGDVCCGDYNLVDLTATTSCSSKSCTLAQFCRTSAECPSGVQCLAQSCAGGANVHLCGLKSGPPYNCVAN